jgi:hypothetical protein
MGERCVAMVSLDARSLAVRNLRATLIPRFLFFVEENCTAALRVTLALFVVHYYRRIER